MLARCEASKQPWKTSSGCTLEEFDDDVTCYQCLLSFHLRTGTSAGGTSAATVVAVTAGLASVGFLTTSFDGAPIERQLSDAENTKTVLS